MKKLIQLFFASLIDSEQIFLSSGFNQHLVSEAKYVCDLMNVSIQEAVFCDLIHVSIQKAVFFIFFFYFFLFSSLHEMYEPTYEVPQTATPISKGQHA